MDQADRDERLREITGRFFEWKPTLAGAMSPPFDTSKPNLHDSKADFIEEKRAVEKAPEQATGLLEFLTARYRPEDAGHELAGRVLGFVDFSIRERSLLERPESLANMICKNAADAGFTYCLILW